MLQHAQPSAQTIVEYGTFHAEARVHAVHVSFKCLLCSCFGANIRAVYQNCILQCLGICLFPWSCMPRCADLQQKLPNDNCLFC